MAFQFENINTEGKIISIGDYCCCRFHK